MLVSLLAGLAALGAADPPASATAVAPAPAAAAFEGREQARIPFVRSIRGFRGEREGGDDVLYLEARLNTWYRAEVSCFGIGDIRNAHALLPVDRGFGVDRFSRIAFFEFGDHDANECRVDSLVQLTREEAEARDLVRPRPTRD